MSLPKTKQATTGVDKVTEQVTVVFDVNGDIDALDDMLDTLCRYGYIDSDAFDRANIAGWQRTRKQE